MSPYTKMILARRIFSYIFSLQILALALLIGSRLDSINSGFMVVFVYFLGAMVGMNIKESKQMKELRDLNLETKRLLEKTSFELSLGTSQEGEDYRSF